MVVVQLTASRFYGGPERQIIGLAEGLDGDIETVFMSFSEEKLCVEFLQHARRAGYEAMALENDTPRIMQACRELANALVDKNARILVSHGYKADIVGLFAARRVGIPIIGVSRGWTGQCIRVRVYELLDRLVLRWMDRIVCVSEEQAKRVRAAGVPSEKISVIRNAVRPERFSAANKECRKVVGSLFNKAPRFVVGAAGRLSPEKGFILLVEAAEQVLSEQPEAGFVLFGDGVLREALEREIERRGMSDRFIMPGFRADLDEYMGQLDVLAVPSFTEGLPNVILEAFAAGVPVVATAVGGTPEVVEHGINGYLVRAGDASGLARCITSLLSEPEVARAMGQRGKRRVISQFTFERQAEKYRRLFYELVRGHL